MREPGHLPDDLGQLANAVVLLGLTDVERLIVDRFARCFQGSEECARDVFDVNGGRPRRAVALDQDATGGLGPRHEVFSTRSKLWHGETPYAVALRRNVGLNSSLASFATSSSTRSSRWCRG